MGWVPVEFFKIIKSDRLIQPLGLFQLISLVQQLANHKITNLIPFPQIPYSSSWYLLKKFFFQRHLAWQFPVKVRKTLSNMTPELSTLALSPNGLRNIPKAPFQSLGIEWPQCGNLKCFEPPKFWWTWPHFVQVLEVYSSITSITVAPGFKPWNLRVCLKRLCTQWVHFANCFWV